MVDFSIFDAIANENDFVFDERDCKSQVQQQPVKSHELTAAQTETKTQTKEYFPISIFDSTGSGLSFPHPPDIDFEVEAEVESELEPKVNLEVEVGRLLENLLRE